VDATCAWGQDDARLRRLASHGGAKCNADMMKMLDCTNTKADIEAAMAAAMMCPMGDNTTCGNATAGFGECALGVNDTCATTNALGLQVVAMMALPEAEQEGAAMGLMGCNAEKMQQMQELENMPEPEAPEAVEMSPLLTGVMTDMMACEAQTECSGLCVAESDRRLASHGGDAAKCEPDMAAVTAKACDAPAAGDDDDDDDDAAADTTSSAAILAAVAYLA